MKIFSNTFSSFLFVFFFINFYSVTSSTLPVVLWHGMGDSCCNPLSLGKIKETIEKETNNTYVLSLKIGNNFVEDTLNGYLLPANDHVKLACAEIQADLKLSQGYNAIGFSQGGQFFRALAQRCPQPRMSTLISVGGQHQGVYGLPHCNATNNYLCSLIRHMLSIGVYTEEAQNHITQAGYWHDPMEEQTYEQYSSFLADINQERTVSQDYKSNLMLLKKFVMVLFEQDSMVQPKESEWFGFYKTNQTEQLYTLQQSDLYVKDLLGLRELDERGAIDFLSVPGDHLQFSLDWFSEQIVHKYLIDQPSDLLALSNSLL